MNSNHPLTPWPDVATVRSFLRFITGFSSDNPPNLDTLDKKKVAEWLIQHGLGPLALHHCRTEFPDIARHLQADVFSAFAEHSLHNENLTAITERFTQQDIPLVLLKGAALGRTVYQSQTHRIMSDVDLWVQSTQMRQACELMQTLEFAFDHKSTRPLELQILSDGEVRFFRPDRPQSLIELHLSPFPGWWLQRTANVNTEAVWSRIEKLDGESGIYQMAAEDMLIHVAIHLIINHQFGLSAVRSLIDIALITQKLGIDWQVVAERAQRWRVATAVYTVLHHTSQLFDLPGIEQALDPLRPSRAKQTWLNKLVTTENILAGDDLSKRKIRLLLLLLLIDRPIDTSRLMFRTVWPEKEWLEARYQEPTNHIQHIWRMLRSGQV